MLELADRIAMVVQMTGWLPHPGTTTGDVDLHRFLSGIAFQHLTIALFWVRIVLFGAFVCWALAGGLLLWLKVTIYRLFEAEKGALTAFSAVLTAAAASIRWCMDNMLTPPPMPL